MSTLVTILLVSGWVTLITLMAAQNGLSPSKGGGGGEPTAKNLPSVYITGANGNIYMPESTIDLSGWTNLAFSLIAGVISNSILLPVSTVQVSLYFSTVKTTIPIVIPSQNRYASFRLFDSQTFNFTNSLDNSNGTIYYLRTRNNLFSTNYTIPNLVFAFNFASVGSSPDSGIDVRNEANLTTIGNITLASSTYNTVFVSDNSRLEYFGGVSIVNDPSLSVVQIENNPVLTYFGVVKISPLATSGKSFSFFGNTLLSEASITRIMQEFDASGKTNMFLNFGATSVTSHTLLAPAGLTAYNNLVGKGWNFFGW